MFDMVSSLDLCLPVKCVFRGKTLCKTDILK